MGLGAADRPSWPCLRDAQMAADQGHQSGGGGAGGHSGSGPRSLRPLAAVHQAVGLGRSAMEGPRSQCSSLSVQ